MILNAAVAARVGEGGGGLIASAMLVAMQASVNSEDCQLWIIIEQKNTS